MTCDKCYHNEVCSALYEMNGIPRIGATQCAFFKDEARVVKIPVRFGDIVWKTRGKTHPTCGVVDRIEILSDGYVQLHLRGKGYCVWGVSAYATPEEAEKALAEREGNR